MHTLLQFHSNSITSLDRDVLVEDVLENILAHYTKIWDMALAFWN